MDADDTTPTQSEITVLLKAMKNGDPDAFPRLIQLIYPDLKRLAAAYLRSERDDHTLQATALVHEAFLRFAGQSIQIEDRLHFRAVAAACMRRVLVDYARARQTTKRGSARKKIDIDDVNIAAPSKDQKILALEESLQQLAHLDERQAKVVEQKFYGGLSEREISEVLGISERTVKRDWKQARAWLYGQIGTKVDDA